MQRLTSPIGDKPKPTIRIYLIPMLVGLALWIILSVFLSELSKPRLPNPYTDSQNGFSISYPDGWYGKENYPVKTLFPQDNYTAAAIFYNDKGSITIHSRQIAPSTNLEGYVFSQRAHELAMSKGKFNLTDNYPIQVHVNGRQAYYIMSSVLYLGHNVENREYYISDGPRVLAITLACYVENCPEIVNAFVQSVNSTRITK